jgi:uncharacterized protein (TIGR00255 family)
MPLSMTGFGRGTADGKGRRYVVEARSVNSRYCEVKVSAPRDLLELEHLLSLRVRETFARGKFEVLLKNERLRGGKNSIDAGRLTARWRELDGVRKKIGLKEPVSLEAVWASSPAGGEPEESDIDAADLFIRATDRALRELKAFRVREGKRLSADIARRLSRVEASVKRIGEVEPSTRESRMEKLRGRVTELLKGAFPDERRLEAELALLVDRSDISEEIVRLGSHVGRFRQLIGSDREVGRELDFLIQEMNREINTIGSKANDLGVVGEVIFVKAEIEKIREQVQNLE